MLIRNYTLRFVTPAFLGNAEQTGQWRTPPIKSLLRQWWRVAYAADQPGSINSTTVSAMRVAEGELFGVAADSEGASRKSQLRIRLSHWRIGALKSWDRLEQPAVVHPEVERTGYKVGPHAYLGFGPLDGRNRTRLSDKCNAAIQVDESAQLSLAFPAGPEAGRLHTALSLLHQYGTLGGRSRNGWGSFTLQPADGETPALDGPLSEHLSSDWSASLLHDWPHAIGRDSQGALIWQTGAMLDWKSAMRRLAEIKIGLRRLFIFTTGQGSAKVEDRHWLSHPVTNHNVAAWKKSGQGDYRLPNSLRFKVRADADGQLRGVIFHMPCLPPPQFKPDRSAIEGVWQSVHSFLDQPAQALQRTAA